MVRELCNEQAMCDIYRPYAEIADYLDGSNRFSNGQLVFHGAIVPLDGEHHKHWCAVRNGSDAVLEWGKLWGTGADAVCAGLHDCKGQPWCAIA